MMRLHVFLAVLTLSVSAMAQGRLHGRIVDKGGEPVAGAVVKVYGGESGAAMVAFGTSDRDGNYSVIVKVGHKRVAVKIAALGYDVSELSVSDFRVRHDVTMQPSPLELKEVTVRAVPVKEHGDTLVYDVASFASASDRNMEDVISRLPGISIEGNGQIKYNGESINKFYIEGLDMLSGRYTLATKNISPADVSSVSVYENHQPKRVLEGVTFSDRAALNLTLKKKRMLKPIGHVMAGAGYGDDGALWKGEAFGMLIASNMQSMFTLKGNNSGDVYINELRSYGSAVQAGTTLASDMFRSSLFGKPDIAATRYSRNKSASATANGISKLREGLTLTANVAYLYDFGEYSSRNVTRYHGAGDDDIVVDEYNASRLRMQEASVGLKLENNTKGAYVLEHMLFKGKFADNSHRLDNAVPVGQLQNTDDYSVANRFNIILRNGRRVWEIVSDISVNNTPVNYIHAVNPVADTLMVNQVVKGLSVRSSHSTSLSWVLGEGSNVGVALGFDADYDRLRSELTQRSQAERDNEVSGYRLITWATPYYQLSTHRMSVRFEVPVKMYDMGFVYGASATHFNMHRPYVDARATVKYDAPFRLRTSLSLSRTYQIGSMRDFLIEPIYTSYRAESVMGSGVLGVHTSTGANFTASYRNALQGLSTAMRLSYRTTESNTMRRSSVSADLTESGVGLVSNRSDVASCTMTLSEYVRDIGTTFFINATASTSSRKTMRNDRVLRVRSAGCVLEPSVKSMLFDDRLTINLSGRYSFSQQRMPSIGLVNRLSDFSLALEAAVFPWRDIQVYVRPDYTDVSLGAGNRKKDIFVDGGVRYMPGKWELELRCRNVTNRSSYTYSRFDADDTYVTTYSLRPAELLFTAKYKF